MQILFFSPRRLRCMPLLAIILVWTALILFTQPVYAYAGIPSAVLADEIDQPSDPDAYPTLKGMWCNWGAASCSPCAYNVEETFATLRTHGDLMGFNLGTHPDPHGIFTNHWQGIQRISTGDGKYLIVTRDSIDDAVGDDWSGFAVVYLANQPGDGSRFHPNRLNVDYWNRYVKPNSADAIVATTLISKQYEHPGGIQTAGNILAVGTGNMIYFYDLTHRYTPERLTTVIHRPNRTGSSTSLTMLADGRYLLIVGHSDASVLDFYVSNSGFPDSVDGFTHFDEWWPSEVYVRIPPPNGWSLKSTFWEAFQSINLVTECVTGNLYLVGTGNNGINSSRFGADWVYLYKLTKSAFVDHAAITLVDAAHKNCSYMGATNCNFDAAAGVYVDNQGNLNLLSTEHWNNGPDGTIKMEQFRSQYVVTCATNDEAWVELFEHDHYRGTSLLVDYTDKNLENYADLRIAENFDDTASSIRWCLPPDMVVTLYTDKDPCKGSYRLKGDEFIQGIPNLHDEGYGDRFSCLQILADPPASLWIDPWTKEVFSYNYPVSPSALNLARGTNAAASVTVEVPPLDLPEPTLMELKPYSPNYDYGIPDELAFAGYAINVVFIDKYYQWVTFSDPVTLTIQYDDDDIGDIPEGNMNIYTPYFDGSNTTHVPVDQICPGADVQHNLDEDWISARICEPGSYLLLGEIPAPPPRWLLFDEAHANRNTLNWTRAVSLSNEIPWHPDPEWLYFGDLEPELADIVDFVSHESGALTRAKLDPYDILMIVAADDALTDDEVRAVRDFVNAGGGLVVLNDCGTSFSTDNLLSAYGIHMDNVCLFMMEEDPSTLNGDLEMATFDAHPAADDVASFMGNWGHGMRIDQPAEWLVSTWGLETWSDTSDDGVYQSGEEGDFITGAVYDQGCGRVVALGDNTFNQAYSTYGNYDFIRSILKWVSGGQYCEGQPVYLPMLLR